MLYFLDTEFMEDGRTIELISVGLVCQDGREYYAESSEAELTRANAFVRERVIPKLGPAEERKERGVIRQEIERFVRPASLLDELAPAFVADYASYDWIALCQLFGTMLDLPNGWPMFCLDLQQYIHMHRDAEAMRRVRAKLQQAVERPHHALEDARFLALAWKMLVNEWPHGR